MSSPNWRPREFRQRPPGLGEGNGRRGGRPPPAALTLISCAATPPCMARSSPDAPAPGKIANLCIIWGFVARYKGHVAGALVSLLVALAATLAIPNAFRLIIDKGFAASGGD